MVSLQTVYNCPEKDRLRSQLQYQKEKYDKKYENYNKRRRDKQVATLKDVLDSLQQKHLLEAEQDEMLLNLSGCNDELFQILRKKLMNERIPRQYEPQLRVLALTLHYYSPRAYEYVRRHFDLCLPRTKTKWFHHGIKL